MKTINWLFIVAGTFIMIYVMSSTGRSLKTPATPLGILNLEFAYNQPKVAHILNAWTLTGTAAADNIRIAIKNTWLDFIFLFFYSLFLFYACKRLAESFTGLLQQAGKYLAIGAMFAGLFDIAENAGMLLSLNGFSSNGLAMFTTICASLKWVLVITAIAYLVILGPLFLLKKINKKQ